MRRHFTNACQTSQRHVFERLPQCCILGTIRQQEGYDVLHFFPIMKLNGLVKLERVTRFERATSSLARKCSTTELHPHLLCGRL